MGFFPFLSSLTQRKQPVNISGTCARRHYARNATQSAGLEDHVAYTVESTGAVPCDNSVPLKKWQFGARGGTEVTEVVSHGFYNFISKLFPSYHWYPKIQFYFLLVFLALLFSA